MPEQDAESYLTVRVKRPFWQSDDKPISCRQLAPVLQAYLDGQVDDTDIELIKEHLDACRDCGLEAETYEQLKTALSRHKPAVPSDTLERLRAFSHTLADQVAQDQEPEQT